MKYLLTLVFLFCGSSFAGDFIVLGGFTQYDKPSDGTYWNVNQQASMDMTPPAAGIRWGSARLPFNTSLDMQYTYFGTAKTNALAVSVDAPYHGGYIPGGKCVGTCAPLYRWKMESEAQSIAIIGVKHLGNFGLEWGANWYETKTKGHVEDLHGANVYEYSAGKNFAMSQMFGVSYKQGPWSVRLQTWFMDGPSRMNANGKEEAPATFNDTQTWTLLAGYTF